MKIAFVGKGGSGKSTVSGLFIRHLVNTNQKILAIDADINQHLATMIGAAFDPKKALSLEKYKLPIRTHLSGSNPRIHSAKTMIKTTPPGSGSQLVTIDENDAIIQHYGVQFAPNSYFLHVGTYEEDGIGKSCYHTSLSIFENILSHTQANRIDEWVIVDMVAGTDAFSGPLHAMFDIIYMVVEPTPESVAVSRQFMGLAKNAGVADQVRSIANKVEDADDVSYIVQETGQQITAQLAYDPNLRKQRRGGGALNATGPQKGAMERIAETSRNTAFDPDIHLRKLHVLHDMFAREQFTIDKYGDTLSHIDPEFSFHAGGES